MITPTLSECTAREELRLTMRNDLAELGRVNDLATELLARNRIDESTVYATQLALEEALSNVIRHGYDDASMHEIDVLVRVEPTGVEIQLVDDGHEFDPVAAPRPRLAPSIGAQRPGGLGVHLLRAFVSEMRYQRRGGRNELSLRI